MKIKQTFVVLPVLLFSLTLINCNKNKETTFVIKVDSIHVADTINLDETLRIEFFGTIGDNGCYSFSHDES